MVILKKHILAASALFLVSACSVKEDAPYIQTAFIMSTQAHVRVFGASDAEAKKLADAVFKEWRRISAEYSITEPYSSVAYVNKNAFRKWVRVDDEFLGLLVQGMDYFSLTGGAFDITFAPLWPIWREAAASKKMPAKEEINKALANMGSGYVQIDRVNKMLRFTRPVEINLGGLLRSYALERGRTVVREAAGGRYQVELKIGGNILAYGKRDWYYEVPDPFHEGASLGRLHFGEGLVLASSGRDHFVRIEGKLYSHILDLKSGYPVPDFSNLLVFFPNTEKDEYIPSAVFAVMGREKAFALLSRVQGAAALWIDGSGGTELLINGNSAARWEKTKSLF